MATEFKVVGPIPIPTEKATNSNKIKWIHDEQVSEFWQDEHAKALKEKIGCYVFALRAGRGYTPWYVGQASKSFEQEIFTDHKVHKKYNSVLRKGRQGTPVMLFVCRNDNRRKIAQPELNSLETFLIQSALFKNPELTNIQGTKNIPEWTIRGVIRSGKGSSGTLSGIFKKMMGL